MDEIDLKDQLAALLKEIRAQTAKVEVISAMLDRITAKSDWVTVKPVTALAASSTAAATSMVSPVQPAAATSMVSPLDVHDVVPPSSGQFSVSSSSPATSATNFVVSIELANDNDDDAGEHCDDSKPSPTAELVAVSARTAAESSTVTPAGVTSIIPVAPVTCSTECPSSDANVLTPASTPAAAPMSSTATVDIIPILTATKASDGTFDEVASKGAASMVTTSSTGSTHSGVYASVFVIIPSLPPSLSLAPTALTPIKVSDTLLLQPFSVQVFSSLAPINDSIACLDALRLSNQVPTVQDENKHYRTPWPPPYQYLSCCDSSKSRPAPWPSFGDLPGGMHLTEPRPWLQKSEKVILSGLINSGTSVFELCAKPGFEFLLLDTTIEEVAPWLSEDNQTAVQHFHDSVSCGVHRSNFALFQWESAWQLEGSANYASNKRTLDGKEVLVTWSHFLRIQILALPSKEKGLQTNPMSLAV